MNNSRIEWTDHTFNGWIGCTKVSSACRNCYAENIAINKGLLQEWGAGSPRKKTSPKNWIKPFAWNQKARNEGTPARVFCSSMADVFDDEISDNWRRELFVLIELTRFLDWQILTKRPHLIEPQLRRIGYWDKLPLANVWMGATAEDQSCFDERWPHLRSIPAHVRFISYEPALGPLILPESVQGELDWLIAGGETVRKKNESRLSDPSWFRSVRDQCENLGIAYFFKQWGNDLVMEDGVRQWVGKTARLYRETHHLLDGQVHQNFPVHTLDRLNATTEGGMENEERV